MVLYTFLLVFTIPIYFSIKYILKKLNIEKPQNKIFLSVINIFILTPLVYLSIFSLFYFSLTYQRESEFNPKEWRVNIEERHEMSKDIINSKMLIGMSKSQVIEMLGENDFIYSQDHWAYDIGFVPGLFNIDPSVLDVYFESDIVVKVTQHET